MSRLRIREGHDWLLIRNPRQWKTCGFLAAMSKSLLVGAWAVGVSIASSFALINIMKPPLPMLVYVCAFAAIIVASTLPVWIARVVFRDWLWSMFGFEEIEVLDGTLTYRHRAPLTIREQRVEVSSIDEIFPFDTDNPPKVKETDRALAREPTIGVRVRRTVINLGYCLGRNERTRVLMLLKRAWSEQSSRRLTPR